MSNDERLTRAAVVEAALEMLDAAGADSLSMRSLADRLGVKAGSLYWHIRDKDQLLEDMAEAVLDRVPVQPGAGRWQTVAERACGALAAELTAHPAEAGLLLGCVTAVRRSRFIAGLSAALASAGLDDAEAAALALAVQVAAGAKLRERGGAEPAAGRPLTLEIESGSWRVVVRPAPPGATDVARSVGGGGAASVDVRPEGRVIVRNRRGGDRGAVELARSHPWLIKVHGGTWSTSVDLTGLLVTGVELDSGAGNVTCTLPAPRGVVPVRVNSGIVGVSLHRPPGVAARATVHQGSVKVRLDDQTLRAGASDVQWSSPGAAAAADRYEVTVHSGCVRVSLDTSAPSASRPPAVAAPASSPDAPGPAPGVALLLDGIERRLAAQQR